MLVECRFCLEEVEVEEPLLYDKKECSETNNTTISDNKKKEEIELEELELKEKINRNNNGGYVELTPVTQSKRQRKNIGNRLVRPCDCRGTQRHVHIKCLCEWIGKCNKWYCSVCHRVYNLSPHHLHYCVMKLQRRGVLKNLPPIYSSSEFSRSSYFALLLFMGTLSMLMLPSTLPNINTTTVSSSTSVTTTVGSLITNNKIISSFINYNNGGNGNSNGGLNNINNIINNDGGSGSGSGGTYNPFIPPFGVNSDTTTAGYNPFPNSAGVDVAQSSPSFFTFYPSSSFPSIYVSSTGSGSQQFYNTNSIPSSSINKINNINNNNQNNLKNENENNSNQNNKEFESSIEPYFNSQGGVSSIFSSCKLKNQDEKFSSFVCHASPYSPNVLNSINNPNPQQFSFNFPTIIRGSNYKNEISDNQQDKQHQQDQQQKEKQQQFISQHSSKSPILNSLGSYHNNDIQYENIYIAHQKYHRVTIKDSLKNIFCNILPIQRFCY